MRRGRLNPDKHLIADGRVTPPDRPGDALEPRTPATVIFAALRADGARVPTRDDPEATSEIDWSAVAALQHNELLLLGFRRMRRTVSPDSPITGPNGRG
jgi:hypothetical protein